MKRVLALSLLLLLAIGAYSQKSKNAADRSGFVVLSEAVPDVILEIRYYSTYNFVGTRIDGYL